MVSGWVALAWERRLMLSARNAELTLTRGSKRLLTAKLQLARQVLVSHPVERQVTDYEEFTGTTPDGCTSRC
jgi:hypothetical protein